MATKKCKYQGFLELNNKRYLFIPSNEKLEISNCLVEGIICTEKDFNRNLKKISTLNQGVGKINIIFLDKPVEIILNINEIEA